jgi:hypothetical protein
MVERLARASVRKWHFSDLTHLDVRCPLTGKSGSSRPAVKVTRLDRNNLALRDLDLSQLLEATALSACGPVHALSAAGRQLDAFREVTMIRLIAIAGFAVSIAVSAQAMTVAPTIAQPDSMVTEVAAACGVGRTRINGVCVARTTVRQTRRAVRRCARGTTC